MLVVHVGVTQGQAAAPEHLSDFGRALLVKLSKLTTWADVPYASELRELVLGQQPEEAASVVGALRQHIIQEQQCPLEARVAALYLMSAVLKAGGCPPILTEQLSAAFHEMFKLVWDAADDENTRARLRLIVSYVATNPELRSKVGLEEHIALMTELPARDAAAAAARPQRALKDTTLMLAAEQGHVGIVVEMIEEGADLGAKDEYGTTPLHYAARKGHQEVVKELLAAGADVNAATKGGQTPLKLLASKGHLAVVKEALAAWAYVNSASEDGWTPARIAAFNRLREAARGVVPASDWDEKTQLHVAASDGNLEVVKELLAAGADVKAANWVCRCLV
ncbi:hypothetical protein GPECTOR_93g624 [Gonium pectorale]|uniref:Uncharacterized protein n=1 Tax=Gonium pectorale TaxID=33097 RepID=A0A150G0I6_GONPE|nr:hypothetical protein GPECTOR_93g624 [Gonium pectorale]|eukprot:KXZ43354.1 hypothetical protein GPECTOR_93g624 [Gonium pectorale]